MHPFTIFGSMVSGPITNSGGRLNLYRDRGLYFAGY